MRVTLPDGGFAVSSNSDFAPILSGALGRSVALLAKPPEHAQLEEFWPDREEMASPDIVTDEAMPVLLKLLDQVYALRKALNDLTQAIKACPQGVQDVISSKLK